MDYYTGLAYSTLNAINCHQYDIAADLLRTGVAYGPNEGVAPELVAEAVSNMYFYQYFYKFGMNPCDGDGMIDPMAYLEKAVILLEKVLESV